MQKLFKIEEDKNVIISNKLYDFRNPSYIYIPVNFDLDTHSYIYKNTCLNNYITSVSGEVVGVEENIINNKLVKTYVIKNDFKENCKLKSKRNIITNLEELKSNCEEKILTKILKKINVNSINKLVITSIDEEVYTANEFMMLSNNFREILDTIDELISILNLTSAELVIKNTNLKSIKNVRSILGTYPNINLTLVPDKYLISRKDFLCEYLNINFNDTLCLNTNDIYDIYNLINNSKLKTEKLITISGNAIKKSFVINVRLYSRLDEILKEFIKIEETNFNVFINGILSGVKIDDYAKLIITDEINSIIINKIIDDKETECINCGACKKICPYNINVLDCYKMTISSFKCISCGLCNYICPANIDLKSKVEEKVNEKE